MRPHFASFWQKNGRAGRQARRCRASAGRTGPLRAAGLLHRQHRKMILNCADVGSETTRVVPRASLLKTTFGNPTTSPEGRRIPPTRISAKSSSPKPALFGNTSIASWTVNRRFRSSSRSKTSCCMDCFLLPSGANARWPEVRGLGNGASDL